MVDVDKLACPLPLIGDGILILLRQSFTPPIADILIFVGGNISQDLDSIGSVSSPRCPFLLHHVHASLLANVINRPTRLINRFKYQKLKVGV